MPRDRLRYCFWRIVSYDNQVVIFLQDPRSVCLFGSNLKQFLQTRLNPGELSAIQDDRVQKDLS